MNAAVRSRPIISSGTAPGSGQRAVAGQVAGAGGSQRAARTPGGAEGEPDREPSDRRDRQQVAPPAPDQGGQRHRRGRQHRGQRGVAVTRVAARPAAAPESNRSAAAAPRAGPSNEVEAPTSTQNPASGTICRPRRAPPRQAEQGQPGRGHHSRAAGRAAGPAPPRSRSADRPPSPRSPPTAATLPRRSARSAPGTSLNTVNGNRLTAAATRNGPSLLAIRRSLGPAARHRLRGHPH